MIHATICITHLYQSVSVCIGVVSRAFSPLSVTPDANNPDASRVTWDSVRKFKHLSISLGFKAISDLCQAAFDHPDTDLDEWPEVAPDHRPGCWCTLDVAKFTELTAAMIVLTKIIHDDEGELPPEVEAKVIHTTQRFYYEDI